MIFAILLDDSINNTQAQLARMELGTFPYKGMVLVLRKTRYVITNIEGHLIPDGEDEPHRVEFKLYVQDPAKQATMNTVSNE